MRRLTLISVLLAASAVTFEARAQNGPFQFFPLSPCRMVDTRGATTTNGGP